MIYIDSIIDYKNNTFSVGKPFSTTDYVIESIEHKKINNQFGVVIYIVGENCVFIHDRDIAYTCFYDECQEWWLWETIYFDNPETEYQTKDDVIYTVVLGGFVRNIAAVVTENDYSY